MLKHNSTATYTPEGQNLDIAYLHHISNNPDSPYILFLHGLMSDMNGAKAQHLLELCKTHGLNFLTFDNLGHGNSSGEFTEQTIGSWLKTTEIMLQQITAPVTLVGSSMGAWLALLIAQNPKYHTQLRGLVTLAAAPDFTETIWNYVSDKQREELKMNGISHLPNKDGSHHFPISLALIEEARQHLLLPKPSLNITCKTRLIHGKDDSEVPYQNSEILLDKIISNDTSCTIIPGATHRLSDEFSLACLTKAIEGLI